MEITKRQPAVSGLRHSDVVLSYAGSPDDMSGLDPDAYARYGVTVWGWGPYYDSRLIAAAFGWGFRMVSSLVNLDIRESHTTDVGRDLFYNPQLRETTCRDITGAPIVISWWAREYGDDNRAYWHCTNQRLYREHLKRVVRSGVLAGANAIHIDDAMSSAMVVRLPDTGGCFCDACMTGFHAFLRERYGEEGPPHPGVIDMAAFDYRALVRRVAPTREAFGAAFARHEIPLQDDFRLFMTQEAARFLGELAACAKETAGADIPVSANLGVMRPDNLLGLLHPDHFVIELEFWRPTGDFPLLALKIAQAAARKCATWPLGRDVDRVRLQGATGILKLWVAGVYALGHNFMIPVHMWCATSAHDFIWYDAPEEEFVPLYRFIRDSAAIFDGFEEATQFGLVYSNALARAGDPAIENTCWEMFDRGFAFQLLLAGDDYLTSRLDPEAAEQYDRIVIPNEAVVAALDPEQRRVVDDWLAAGKAVYWRDAQAGLPAPRVRVLQPDTLWTVVRRREADGVTETAIHLLNHDDHIKENAFGAGPRVTLALDRTLFGATVPATATLYSPGAPAIEVGLHHAADGARATFEMRGFWNILVFRGD
jgi:hypothetical protein